jgi:dolichol-phosphate mannosyltransferase
MMGFVVSICSLLAAVYYVIKKLTIGLQPPGFATLTVLLLFLGGVQMITVGIIGEYIGHILDEVKGRPTYIVQHVFEHQNLGQS